MLSRKAKHLAIAEGKTICSMARFFTSLCSFDFAQDKFAQNDKGLHSFPNKIVTITNVIESVSLSKFCKDTVDLLMNADYNALQKCFQFDFLPLVRLCSPS